MSTVEDRVSSHEISAFRMPSPSVGQTVVFYEHAIIQPNRARGAIVVSVRNGSITVFDPVMRQNTEGVKYVTDPRLRMNAEQRSGGAWDFTDETKLLRSITQQVASLIQQFEDFRATAPADIALDEVTRKSPGRGEGTKYTWKLRHQAKDLGYPNDDWKTLSNEACIAYIRAQGGTIEE